MKHSTQYSIKSTISLAIILTLAFNTAIAEETVSTEDAVASEVEVEIAPNKDGANSVSPNMDVANFCFFAGAPPSDYKYTVVRKLKLGKGTYGGVKEILPKFAEHAKRVGADAIINYTGSQRFGFFPWRVVRPVVRGVAIKWSGSTKPDCAAIGGTTLNAMLTTDKPPAQ
jgi:hypothetical protein